MNMVKEMMTKWEAGISRYKRCLPGLLAWVHLYNEFGLPGFSRFSSRNATATTISDFRDELNVNSFLFYYLLYRFSPRLSHPADSALAMETGEEYIIWRLLEIDHNFLSEI